MSDRCRVMLPDLDQAARCFHDEAGVLRSSGSLPARLAGPDTGDAALTEMLDTVLDEMTTLHAHAAEWLTSYGDRLKAVHDAYQEVDQSMHELFDDLMKEG